LAAPWGHCGRTAPSAQFDSCHCRARPIRQSWLTGATLRRLQPVRSFCDAASPTRTGALNLELHVHKTAVAAKVGIGATSTLKVRERLARYTGNMVPLGLGLPLG
jgi:hypothetical protein